MKLLAAFAAALMGCATAAAVPVQAPAAPSEAYRPIVDVAMEQWDVIQYMVEGTPAEDTRVNWVPCGFENAFFQPPLGPIELCLDLDPNAAVFAAAHEAGHALVFELEMYTEADLRDPEFHERAADELAALFLIEMGKEDELVGGAQWFMKDLFEEGDGVHPQNNERVWHLLCLEEGSRRDGTPACQLLYHVTWNFWADRLFTALNDE